MLHLGFWNSCTHSLVSRVSRATAFGTSFFMILPDVILDVSQNELNMFFLIAGTVFREPILCRNIPRIVPGNALIPLLMSRPKMIKKSLFEVQKICRMEETYLHREACLWRPVSCNWSVNWWTRKAKNGLWWAHRDYICYLKFLLKFPNIIWFKSFVSCFICVFLVLQFQKMGERLWSLVFMILRALA